MRKILKPLVNLRPQFLFEEVQSRKLASAYKINEKYKRIYFYHVRKTGGTSLNLMFLNALAFGKKTYDKLSTKQNHRLIVDEKIIIGWNKLLLNQGNYYYGFSHIPYHQLSIPKDSYTFTVLRDPIDRVVSHYKMIKFFLENDINHPSLKVEKQYYSDNFEKFVENLPKEVLLNQIYMFSKDFNIREAESNIRTLENYFILDEFKKGVEKINKDLNFNLEAIHTRKSTVKDQFTIDRENIRYKLDIEYSLLERLFNQNQ